MQANRIETPDWSIVKSDEDDRWEAKVEMETSGLMSGASPVKRLRQALPEDVSVYRPASRRDPLADDQQRSAEDTSDAYYITLHRRHEGFERRQHFREKEQLVFGRHKLRARLELLRNMSPPAWSAVVSAVLSRSTPLDLGDSDHQAENDPWHQSKQKLKAQGIDWLRRLLIKEGNEVLKRYDELLPSDSRK